MKFNKVNGHTDLVMTKVVSIDMAKRNNVIGIVNKKKSNNTIESWLRCTICSYGTLIRSMLKFVWYCFKNKLKILADEW